MEEDKIKRIDENLSALVNFTEVETPFIDYFIEKGILGISDVDVIVSIKQDGERASEFYRIIKNRANAYPVLIQALQMSSQHVVIHILERGKLPPGTNNRLRAKRLNFGDLSDNKRSRLDIKYPMLQAHTQVNVMSPVSLFTGRDHELQELHKKVQRADGTGHPSVLSQLTCISGLGGIGKTQLARKYIQEYGKYYDHNCIWLNAESENSLSESFRDLATSIFDESNPEKKIENVVADVYNYFKAGKCLFVFDNAENTRWLEKKFLPLFPPIPGTFRPHVILTTRNRDWGSPEIEVVDLGELEEEEAVVMVKKGLRMKDDTTQDGDVLQLVKRLQCFPLTIQEAISYIREQMESDNYTVGEFLQEFEMQQEVEEEDDSQNENRRFMNDHTRNTFTTLKMSIAKIEANKQCGHVAVRLLHAMSYLTPDQIKRELFLRLSGMSNEPILKKGVKLLIQYSMVNGHNLQRVLNVHRLVQEVTRIILKREGREELMLEDVLKMICDEKGKFALENGDHMLSIWGHAWGYPELLRKSSYAVHWTAWRLYEKGRDDEVVKFGYQAVERMTSLIGEFHDDLLGTLHYVMSALRRQGHIQEGFKLVTDLLKRLKAIGREGDGRTLNFMTHLGHLYFDQGNNQEALNSFQAIWDKKKTFLSEDDPNAFCTLKNLARALMNVGRLEEAQAIANNCYTLIISKEVTNPAMLLSIRAILGECLNKMGRFEEALEVLQGHSADVNGLVGRDRIEMCGVLGIIGNVLRSKGDYVGALKKHQQAYQDNLERFGKEHLKTLLSAMDTVNDSILLGVFGEETTKLLEENLIKLEELFGKDHVTIADIKMELAKCIKKNAADYAVEPDVLDNWWKGIVEGEVSGIPQVVMEVGNQIERIKNQTSWE